MTGEIFIGWEPREADADLVARASLRAHSPNCPPIYGVVADHLRAAGLYTRKEDFVDGLRWDAISAAPMSTQHAIARFLTPQLARTDWALFMDCDIMARRDINELFALADPRYAVQVVKHVHDGWRNGAAIGSISKMDGQIQQPYFCKNWSSVCLFHVSHPANKALTPDLVNSAKGRDLHSFCWLPMDLIGELPHEWNWLVGIDPPNDSAAIAHFTMGTPSMPGHENCEHADEWRSYL
jgi:lipopolysaccharide biosynthesis glycosyltransferase